MSDQARAMANVQRVVNTRGSSIELVRPGASIVKDDYGSIISEGTPIKTTIKAFPILPSPSERELMRAGIKDGVDLLAYVSRKDLNEASIVPEDIETVIERVNYAGRTYKVKIARPFSHFGGPAGDTFLYHVLGMVTA